MRPVLGEAPVAGFHMAELALEDPERMLNLGPHLRDDPIDLFVELLDLFGEVELFEDRTGRGGEPVDIGDEVRRDVLNVGGQAGEVVFAGVVEGLLAVGVRDTGQHPRHRLFRRTRCLEAGVLGMNPVDAVFKHTVQTAQNHHGQHDEAVLRAAVGAAQALGDLPDVVCKFLMLLNVHKSRPRSIAPVVEELVLHRGSIIMLVEQAINRRTT